MVLGLAWLLAGVAWSPIIVFGVTWTWLGADESPGPHVLAGGALVVGAMVANEALALRSRIRVVALPQA